MLLFSVFENDLEQFLANLGIASLQKHASHTRLVLHIICRIPLTLYNWYVFLDGILRF